MKRFIEGYVLKQDPICLKIFDTLADVVEHPDSNDKATTTMSVVTTKSIAVLSSRDSSEEMQQKLITYTQ